MSDDLTLNRRSLMLGASLAAASYATACTQAPGAAQALAADAVDLTGLSILLQGVPPDLAA